MFSGFGGLTDGIRQAGFDTILAANHNEYKTLVHEANHPYAEHWIANLADPESSDYHGAADLPAADLLVAGITCTNHSGANTQKAYEQGLTLFDIAGDEEYEQRVTRSERDRATALCILQYAEKHHPRMILIECTTEFTSWGPAIPGRKNVGDGSTYRWWRLQLRNMKYKGRGVYLNSQFFGVPQSRDRIYLAFWDQSLPDPDLDHRPATYCQHCDDIVPAVWTWKTGIPPTGVVRYGQQYHYRCPRCRREIVPAMAASITAIDLTNLGTRIGDRAKPLAPATMARAERCRRRFAQFPAVLMPAKAVHGTEKHPWQPMATQTSQQETAILSTGTSPPPVALTGHVIAAHRHNGDGQHIGRPMDTVTSTHEKAMLVAAVNNYQGVPRGLHAPLPTQAGSETLSLVSGGVVPFRKNTVPTSHAEPMPTVTSEQIPGLLTATATVNHDPGDNDRNRTLPAENPVRADGALANGQGSLFSDWLELGDSADPEMPHQPRGTHGAFPTPRTLELPDAEWRAMLAEIALEDCHFRMLGPHEIGRGCGFDVDFPGHQGTFEVWGSARDQVDGFGNAVSPAVGQWIGSRLRAILDTSPPVAA
ncbi:DNA cytosine methyltransferase [Actinoplanes sp. NPDC051859]|uniref:DNA cytosine methyltransferase n=1 Tax=Actinoplanes sp. NPDC051859 TaxID=3363909 RepID=UPI0037B0332A